MSRFKARTIADAAAKINGSLRVHVNDGAQSLSTFILSGSADGDAETGLAPTPSFAEYVCFAFRPKLGALCMFAMSMSRASAAPTSLPTIFHRIIAILWSSLAHENIDVALVVKYW